MYTFSHFCATGHCMEVRTLKIIIITIIIINRNHTSRLSYWQKWRHIIFLCQKRLARGTEGEQKIHIVFIPFSVLG